MKFNEITIYERTQKEEEALQKRFKGYSDESEKEEATRQLISINMMVGEYTKLMYALSLVKNDDRLMVIKDDEVIFYGYQYNFNSLEYFREYDLVLDQVDVGDFGELRFWC